MHVHTTSGVTRANEVNQAGVIHPPACPLAPQPLRLSECLPAVRTHSGAPLKESLLTELARLLSSKGEEPAEPTTAAGLEKAAFSFGYILAYIKQVGQHWGCSCGDQPLNRKTVFETNQALSPYQTGRLGPLLPDVHHRKTKYDNPTFDLDTRQILLQVPDARKCPGKYYICLYIAYWPYSLFMGANNGIYFFSVVPAPVCLWLCHRVAALPCALGPLASPSHCESIECE